MHLGIVLTRFTQDVNNFADGVFGAFGPLNDAHNGLVACLAFLQVFFWDEDVVGQRTVLGEQISIAFLYLQSTHEGFVTALHNFGNGGFSNVMLAAGKQCDLHYVAVHCMQAVAFGHQDRLATFLRLKDVLAVCFAAESAGHHLRRHVQRVAVAWLLLDEVVHEETFQYVHQEHLGRVGV